MEKPAGPSFGELSASGALGGGSSSNHLSGGNMTGAEGKGMGLPFENQSVGIPVVGNQSIEIMPTASMDQAGILASLNAKGALSQTVTANLEEVVINHGADNMKGEPGIDISNLSEGDRTNKKAFSVSSEAQFRSNVGLRETGEGQGH